ncbi:hypothetical protein NLU13_2948 [Sarocladium strictum]|uniref:Uncharacterized protein n=1 Tax=Sarocladium strictum TaxID=5046 RepID=A0AA39L9U5_SARSR|nr:hypothetical protein NLU13_2948 [Sarocladium strictum]
MPHQRRRSGNTSMTDVRRSVTASDPSKPRRPGLSRKHTPQKLGRSHRERERDWTDSWDEERESFPQYCMTCEKQFMQHDEKQLYCSESCRRIDQNSSSSSVTLSSNYSTFHSSTPYQSTPEPRDIIPRATPSRPSSLYMHNDTSPPESPSTAYAQHSSAALSALRSLTLGGARPPSPTSSPTGAGGIGIWPFTRSAATSPSTSYTRPSAGFFSSTYDTSAYHHGPAYGYGYGYGDEGRPLPSRHAGGYGRPKSIELVTPTLGQ